MQLYQETVINSSCNTLHSSFTFSFCSESSLTRGITQVNEKGGTVCYMGLFEVVK